MKVSVNTLTTLHNIEVSNCFEYSGEVYFRVRAKGPLEDEIIASKRCDHAVVVSLSYGVVHYLPMDTKVVARKLKVVEDL